MSSWINRAEAITDAGTTNKAQVSLAAAIVNIEQIRYKKAAHKILDVNQAWNEVCNSNLSLRRQTESVRIDHYRCRISPDVSPYKLSIVYSAGTQDDFGQPYLQRNHVE